MKKTILMVSLALVSWGGFAQHDHGNHGHANKKQMGQMAPMFKDKVLEDAYDKYIALKNALVASDVMEVKNTSVELVLSLQEVKNAPSAFNEARDVANAITLDEQRKAFLSLSAEMATLIKSSKLTMGEIYLEYCPMANGNSGAYWLSHEMEINNPYFGDKMLRCGSVKETIN